MRIILASASPRRKELLKKLFPDFEVIPAKGTEVYTKQHPSEIVQELSGQKAAEIEQTLYGMADTAQKAADIIYEQSRDYLILGADTVVALRDQILGKPRDVSHAKEILRMLAGNVHQVYTGVTLIIVLHGKRQCIEFAECTHVRFYPMTDAEIEAYVRSGEPMDKAGSYGIQGLGGRFVQGIDGDYQNVVGLPTARIYQVLKKIDEIALPF